jgi:superfamily II DNA or RNA helicase
MKREEIQQKALEAVSKIPRAGLSISMGVGKTYIGLQYLSKHLTNGEALVVAPKRDIFQSWIDDAEKFNLSNLLDKITFSTYISLNKQDPDKYQIVILDEAHTTKASHTEFLDEFKGRILGLTGTPPKWLQSEKGLVMQRFYPIVYSFKVEQAVNSQILNDYRIFVHKVTLNTENTIETSQGWKTSERKNYEWLQRQVEQAVSDRQIFFKRIMCINALKQYQSKESYVKKCLKRIPENEKCLVFANTIDQAERLCPNTHHSKKKSTDDLEDFKSGKITRLSAVEQLSEGVTIPELKHIIIMHSYGNEKKASQKIGRALRLNPIETSKIHVLMYEDTVDEKWVKRALEEFNPEKIKLTKI